MDGAYYIGTIIGGLVGAVIWGVVTKKINESKGYYGGFWWGFFLGVIGVIVVAVKPDNRSYTSQSDSSYGYSGRPLFQDSSDDGGSPLFQDSSTVSHNEHLLQNGGWRCASCGAVNASYITTCVCGVPKKDNTRVKERIEQEKAAQKAKSSAADAADALVKYKELLDSGVISEEEFNAKKASLLEQI